MHRLLFRPLLILLTLAALVIALLQAGGRVLFVVLDELQEPVNQWLLPQGIRVSGVSGDWRLLNPVVRLSRIDLPAGHVEAVRFEIDLVESLIRSTLISRRFEIGDGDIGFVHDGERWRFKGGLGSFDLDVADLFYHSDEIAFDSALNFSSDGGDGRLRLAYRGVNRGGAHRHRLTLNNPDAACEDACALELGFDELEAITLVRDASRSASASADGFLVPAALARLGAPRLDELALSWREEAGDAGGVVALNFSNLALTAASEETLGGALVLKTRGVGARHRGQLEAFSLEAQGQRLDLPVVQLELDGERVDWWTPTLDLGAILEFLGDRLPPGNRGAVWLAGLKPRGDALNVRGYWDRGGAGLGYSATLRGIDLEAFGGAPYMRGGGGELTGFARGMQIQLNAEQMDTHWRGLFAENWLMGYAQGLLQAWFGTDYFAMRGLGMRLMVEPSRASGGFALSRTIGKPEEDRLTLLVNVDESSVQDVKRFVPLKLPAGLPEWIEVGPRGGRLEDINFAYHGQILVKPFELARRVDMAANVQNGHLQYHPDWPHVLALEGRIEVAGRDVRVAVERGISDGGAKLDGSRVLLGDNAAYADVVLSTTSTLPAVLDFIRATPLKDYMTFITPDWHGAGALSLDGTLHIPFELPGQHIGETSFEKEFAADIEIGLAGVDLELPEYRMSLGELAGTMTYRYPYEVRGSNVRGRLFGKPALFAARSDDDTVTFSVSGQAAYGDVLTLLELEDPRFLRGGFDFLADLNIELGDEITSLEIVSDLTGLALDLPGEFAKLPEASEDTQLTVRFLDEYQALSFSHGRANGWLHVDEAPIRGAIGFNRGAPLFDSSASELLLSGTVGGFALDEVIPDGEGGTGLELPLRLRNLRAEHVDLEGIRFEDVGLEGLITPEALDLSFEAEAVQGQVSYAGDDPLLLHLVRLQLPASEVPGDPLDVAIIPELPRADVTVDDFRVGEDDYGSWAFELHPSDGGVGLKALEANLRGVAISSPDGVFWDGVGNESRFAGTVRAGDLETVLPQWDFAPTVASTTAEFEADLRWAGSPANVDVDRVIGDTRFAVRDGRFLEVDASSAQGAMRLFSLVNFSTVLKRLNFDFSDVVGEGISFDEIRGEAYFDEGLLTFTEPMEILGTGSEFRIGGQVNLVEGTLNNEMIVTLPVTRSLPWYAAYIALANPLTAIGVIVGERVLRKPIEQFSTAKYALTGPIEDPEVSFVNVWDQTLDEPKTALEAAPAEAPVPDESLDSASAEPVPEEES